MSSMRTPKAARSAKGPSRMLSFKDARLKELDSCFVELRAYILSAQVKEKLQSKMFNIMERMEGIVEQMATPPIEPRSSSLSHMERCDTTQPPTPDIALSLSAPAEGASKKKAKGGGVGRILKRGKKQGTEPVCTQETLTPADAVKSPRKKSMSKYLPGQVKRSVSPSPSSPFPGVSLHNDHAPPPVFVQQDRSELSKFLVSNGTRQPVCSDGNQIAEDRDAVEALTSDIPNYVLRLSNKGRRAVLFGPESEERADIYAGVAAARTISTYPTIPERGRSGDPICDRFQVALFESCSIISVADGCNWGAKPREAAMLASNEVVAHITEQLEQLKDSIDVGRALLTAFMLAHEKIMCTKEQMYEPGTTTLLGGVLAMLHKQQPNEARKWAFVCASVGDCKAFLFHAATNTLTEITAGNRGNITDARDCGGRLGPADPEGGTPDLRNLMLYNTLLEEDDIVFVVSDGVHDNFDPQQLGMSPREFGLQYDDWKEAEAAWPQPTQEAKSRHMLSTMTQLFLSKRQPVTPLLITQSLLEHAQKVTDVTRRFMEDNPDTRQPRNYQMYPGKLDHTTCVSVQARPAPEHPFNSMEKVLSTPIALRKFKEFLANEMNEVRINRPPDTGGPYDTPAAIRTLLLKDCQFLEAVQQCKPSQTLVPEKAPARAAVVFERYICQAGSAAVPVYHDTVEQVAKGFVDALHPATLLVRQRLRNAFSDFSQTDWMKDTCFDPSQRPRLASIALSALQ